MKKIDYINFFILFIDYTNRPYDEYRNVNVIKINLLYLKKINK